MKCFVFANEEKRLKMSITKIYDANKALLIAMDLLSYSDLYNYFLTLCRHRYDILDFVALQTAPALIIAGAQAVQRSSAQVLSSNGHHFEKQAFSHAFGTSN